MSEPQKTRTTSIWKAAAIMLSSSLMVNVGNYVFAFVTARLLGPENYGVLATIFSIIAITAILGTAGNLLAMRSVAHAAPDKWGAARGVRQQFLKAAWYLVFIPIVLLALLSPVLVSVFSIAWIDVIYVIILTFFAIAISIERGFIQGMQNYARISANMLTEMVLKLGGIALVGLIIYKFHPSTTTDVLMVISVYIVSSIIVWKMLWKKSWLTAEVPHETKATIPSLGYISSTILSLVALAILLNADILTAKNALSSFEAGQMAALAKMGQIIFFSTSPIISAVFPLISANVDKGDKHVHLLVRAMIMSIALSLGIFLVFAAFPNLTVRLLFGQQYASTVSLLTRMGLSMVAFTIGNVFINYFLCIKEVRFPLFLLSVAVLHIVLLANLNQSLNMITLADLISFSVLASGSILWYLMVKRKNLPRLIRFDHYMWNLLLHGTEK